MLALPPNDQLRSIVCNAACCAAKKPMLDEPRLGLGLHSRAR
jgi:hypothetical protein